MQIDVWRCMNCGNVVTVERYISRGEPRNINEMGGRCPNSFDGKHSYKYESSMDR